MEAPEQYRKYLKFARIVEEVRSTGKDYYNIQVYELTGKYMSWGNTDRIPEMREVGELWCTCDEVDELVDMLDHDGYKCRLHRLGKNDD